MPDKNIKSKNASPVRALILNDERKMIQLLHSLDVSLIEYYPADDRLVAYTSELEVRRVLENYLTRLAYHSHILKEDQPKMRALLSGSGTRAELRLSNDKGDTLYCVVTNISGDKVVSGEPLVCTIKDVSKELETERDLREQAYRDSMTRVYNRSCGQKLIDEYLRDKDPFVSCGMIVFDIDFFKSINDTYGHLFGDAVLIRVANLLDERFGSDGIVLRAGGDEFVAFLKNVSRKALIRRTAAVLYDVREFKFEENDSKVTCSIGVCFLPENTFGYTYQALFADADWALYRAKKFGRDRYEFCDNLHRYEAAPPAEQHKDAGIDERYLRNDVISTAFEIFEKTPSFDAAIKLLLKVAGARMQLDRITVINTDTGARESSRAYIWTAPGVPEVLPVQAEFTKEDFLTLFRSYDSNGVTVLDYDNMDMYSAGAQALLMQGGAKTVVYAAMYCQGHYSGAVSYVTCEGKRHWSQAQRAQIGELTKIISAHMAKSRVINFSSKAAFGAEGLDPLTGLISFSRFREETERVIVGKTGKEYVVVYSDIVNFKYFNQKYGYQQGDILLKEFASFIISTLTSETDVYFARVVGDQFVLFMPCKHSGRLGEAVDDVNRRFTEKCAENFPAFSVRIRSGIYLVDDACTSASAAIDAANYARRKVQAGAQMEACIYTPELAAVQDMESYIISGLADALKNGEFKVYLQPKFDLNSREIIGAEALARWQRPDGRLLVADDFVHIYEHTSRIVELDYYVFETVAEFLAKNQRLGRRQVPISINASLLHAQDPDTVQRYMDILARHGVAPSLTEIELTETASTTEYDGVIRLFRQLQNVNILTSLDDFGAGYSMLNAVIDIPVNTVKIDRTFLSACETNEKGVYFLKQIVALIKGLGYNVLCEGVETEHELDVLREAGCEQGQGFLLSKPLPIDEYEQLLYGEG